MSSNNPQPPRDPQVCLNGVHVGRHVADACVACEIEEFEAVNGRWIPRLPKEGE